MSRNGCSIRQSSVALLSAIFLLTTAAAPVSHVLAQTAGSAVRQDPKDLTGQWQGTVPAQPAGPGAGQRIVFQVSKADGGGWKTVFNYIDLIAAGNGIPRSANLTLQGSTVQIAVPGNGGRYRGQLSPDGQTITGTWAQDSQDGKVGPDLTLILARAATATAWDVPKPPPPPKAMAADADPAFDVATIKPSQIGGSGKSFGIRGRTFSTVHTSLEDLIAFAYDVHAKQIVNGPDWINTEKYDITGVPDHEGAPSNRQWKLMVQKLLADRFQLTFHHEKRDLNVYILSVAKGGPRNLIKSDRTDDGFSVPIRGVPGGFSVAIKNANMGDFASFALQGAVLDRPVLDQTGIVGRYDFKLTWAQLGSEFGGGLPTPPPMDNPPANLFTGIQEQLGLKLEEVKAPADVMVVDKAEKPSAN
jgi:uncharacterized protein (TIGR03435 family)